MIADESSGTVHLCVDKQRLFAEHTPWETPWMNRNIPTVAVLVAAHPAQAIFNHFVPVRTPNDAGDACRQFYRQLDSIKPDRIDRGLVDVMPELQPFVPPAAIQRTTRDDVVARTSSAVEMSAPGFGTRSRIDL